MLYRVYCQRILDWNTKYRHVSKISSWDEIIIKLLEKYKKIKNIKTIEFKGVTMRSIQKKESRFFKWLRKQPLKYKEDEVVTIYHTAKPNERLPYFNTEM